MATDWKCLDNINSPLRMNQRGDVECMSMNSKDCLWQPTKDDCDRLVISPPQNLSPLTCGNMHKNVWGSPGYDNPNHWCYKGKNQLSHVSSDLLRSYDVINKQNSAINDETRKLDQKKNQVNGQEKEMENKMILLQSRNKMLQESIEKNIYKKKLIYALVSFIILYVIGFLVVIRMFSRR